MRMLRRLMAFLLSVSLMAIFYVFSGMMENEETKRTDEFVVAADAAVLGARHDRVVLAHEVGMRAAVGESAAAQPLRRLGHNSVDVAERDAPPAVARAVEQPSRVVVARPGEDVVGVAGLDDLGSPGEGRTACDAVDRACRKLQIFLAEIVNGTPPAPLKLFPEYEAMQAARGAKAAAPTDLFYPCPLYTSPSPPHS